MPTGRAYGGSLSVASAEWMRAHRARIASGEHVPTPKTTPLPVVRRMSDDERAQLESKWETDYRRTMAAYFLGLRTGNTREAYQRAWRRWLDWCESVGIDPLESPAGTGAVFVAAMREQGYRDASIRQWRAAVTAILNELTFAGLRHGADPFLRVPTIRQPESNVLVTTEDVVKILEAAATIGGQCRTAVLLCAVCGLRASEAGQVTTHTVSRTPFGMAASIVGKGGKSAIVPLPPIVLEAAALEGWPMDGRKGEPRERIRYLVGKAAALAGVHLHPHSFRHWHATAALEAGVPLERVQDSLRHADPKTTQYYNRLRRQQKDHSAHVVASLPAIVGDAATDTVRVGGD